MFNLGVRRSRSLRVAGLVVAVAVAGSLPVARPSAVRADEAEKPSRFALRLKTPHVPGELIVKLRDASSKSAMKAIATAGLTVEEANVSVPSLLRVRGSVDEGVMQAAADELYGSGDVEYVEPNYLLYTDATPNDPRFNFLWGLQSSTGNDIGAIQAWDRTTGSEDVVVGVIDSGMDIRHEDLKDNLYKNPGETPGNGIDDDGNGFVDDVNGWDAVTDTGTMRDQDGHGTHVSGTVGARGNNGLGVVGVNWRVKLLPLRFITVRSGSTFDAIQCVDYAVRLRQSGVNLRVLNNSWGGSGYTQALADVIARANAAGILFVCAAGNDSVDNDSFPHFPSSYELPNVISVGAMSRVTQRAGFSNYGKRSVDIFAPGDEILSTYPDNRYQSVSGTSQASPHVAGIAGLIVAANPNVTVPQMKARILGSATPEIFARTACLTGGRANATVALRSESTAPGTLSDFRLTNVTRSTIAVEWTSVGDDGTSGNTAYYDIRWSNSQITAANFDTATQMNDTRVPLRPGEVETAQLKGCFPADAAIFVAMRVYDKAGNFTQSATVMAEPSGALPSYALTKGPAAEFELGTPLDLKADDAATAVELPFDFPYFGGTYRTIYVSTNGLISFDTPQTAPGGTESELTSISAIAPMWLDLTTDGNLVSGEDVYLDTGAGSVTLRWVAEVFYEANQAPSERHPVTFAVSLHSDGRIDLIYGPGGNRNLLVNSRPPVVGLSDGGCVYTSLGPYGDESLANAPSVTLLPTTAGAGEVPSVFNTSVPQAREGATIQFTVTASDPEDGSLPVTAALPRNATFDASTGLVRFTPDSAQDGVVQFVFSALDSSGAAGYRVLSVFVLDDGNLPEVNYLQIKKKVTFNGVGYRVGSRIEIDGSDVGDAKNNKKAPATKLISGNARNLLSAPGLHTIVVVNPDGTRSGPLFTIR